MPYINMYDRDQLNQAYEGDYPTELYVPGDQDNVGQLNYVITRFLIAYVERHGVSYTNMNNAIGALESAKLEFYRRMVAPYEDQKIKENGDVY